MISDLRPPEPRDNTSLLFLSHLLVVWLELIHAGTGGKVSENTLTALRLCSSQKGAVLVAKAGCGARVSSASEPTPGSPCQALGGQGRGRLCFLGSRSQQSGGRGGGAADLVLKIS